MKQPRRFTQLVKPAITVILLLTVFRSVDTAQIGPHLSRLEIGRVFLLLLVYWGAQGVSAQRWRLFASALGMKGSFFSFFRIYFIGMFFNIGLPSLVGGDLLKAFILSRNTGAPLQSGIATILQDRAAGLIALISLGTGAAILVRVVWRGVPLGLVYFFVWTSVGLILVLVLRGEKLYRGRLDTVSSSLPRRILLQFADFHRTVASTRLRAWTILEITALSFANSAAVIYIVYQMCIATGHPVNLIFISAVVPLIEILTTLPISVTGVGVREWAYIETLGLAGITPDAALTIALALSALVIVRNLGGVFFLSAVPARLRSVRPPAADGVVADTVLRAPDQQGRPQR